jgi:hypothetical protein
MDTRVTDNDIYITVPIADSIERTKRKWVRRRKKKIKGKIGRPRVLKNQGVLTLRVEKEQLDLINDWANACGCPASDLHRKALSGYLRILEYKLISPEHVRACKELEKKLEEEKKQEILDLKIRTTALEAEMKRNLTSYPTIRD